MNKRVLSAVLILMVLFGGWLILPPKTAYAAFDGIIKVRVSPPGQSSDIRVVPHGKYYIAEAPVVQLLDTEYGVRLSGTSVQLLYGEKVMYTGTKITFVRAAGNKEENFIVFPYSPTHKTRTNYYGNIEFSDNNGLCAVNHVYLEDYVLGVFPYEMSTGFPAEALKAQAVCARNYGVKKALASPSGTWHLGDTASSQVYKGVPGVSSTGVVNWDTYNAMKDVVNATARKVMQYNGSVFEAFYSAWNGGETLNAEGWTGNTSSIYGYTDVKADAYDDKYCKNRYWKSRMVNTDLHSATGNDLNQAVQDMLISKYREQYGVTDTNVYIVSTVGIKGLKPAGVPEVAIVYQKLYCDVLFNTESNTKRVTFTAADLKAALDINSAYIAFRIKNNSDGTTALYNVRYGHGVGLSQRGAQQRAIDGKTYTDILKFYYKGITVSTLSVSPPALPAMPGVPAPKAVSASYNSIRVSWTAVPGADGYRVYRASSAAGPYTLLPEYITANSYTSTGLKTGTAYYFKVKAYVLSGTAKIYGTASVAASAKPLPGIPAGFKAASASYNSIRLTWNTVPGATGYSIYIASSAAGPYTGVTGTSKTSYTSTGLKTGKAYYFKVKAYTLVGTKRVYGGLTAATSAKPLPGIPANSTAVSRSYNSIRLTWSAVTGATGYSVFRAESAAGTYSRIGSTASAGYTDTGLKTGTAYYYRVKAYRLVGTEWVYGSPTPVRSAKPVPAIPQSVAAKRASSTSLRVSWAAVAGASGYEVYRATSSTGTYARVTTTTAKVYTNTGLKTGKTYYYKVRAYRIEGKTKVYGMFSPAVHARP